MKKTFLFINLINFKSEENEKDLLFHTACRNDNFRMPAKGPE
jgi:hypothetical protein